MLNPITRNTKFFGERQYQLYMNYISQYIKDQLNIKLVLFRVDRNKTNVDEVYTESGNKVRFLPPVEINVAELNIEEAENKTYINNVSVGRYQEHGNLDFSILLTELEEKNIDILYGDVIGFPETETSIKYYSVVNDGKINFDNDHMLFGYKPFFRSIKCVTLDETQINIK